MVSPDATWENPPAHVFFTSIPADQVQVPLLRFSLSKHLYRLHSLLIRSALAAVSGPESVAWPLEACQAHCGASLRSFVCSRCLCNVSSIL